LVGAIAGFTRCFYISANDLIGAKQIALHALRGAFLGCVGGLVIWLVLFETLIPSKQSTTALILVACAAGWIISNHKPWLSSNNTTT
jgi:hypothetical protein